MPWINRLLLWARALFSRRDAERALEREVAFHVEMETEKLVRDGLERAEARRRALAAFGGVERFKEEVRDERDARLIEDTLADVRLTLRGLRKRPGFAVVVALTLAVGIGATTAVFSWASWLLLRPLPGVTAPNELFTVQFTPDPGRRMTGISPMNARDLRAGVTSVAALGAHTWAGVQIGGTGAPPVQGDGDVVGEGYFELLGVSAQAGRLFSAAELDPAADGRVVVIADRLWRSGFDADTGAIGRMLIVNGEEYRIIGVMEPSFRGTDLVRDVSVWLPWPAYPLIRHYPAANLANRDFRMFMEVVGRVRNGASARTAELHLQRAMRGIVHAYPAVNEIYEKYVPAVTAPIGMGPGSRERIARTMRLLLGIVALVLVIACANVANLLLFRGVRRRGEFAVRRALGATGPRLLRLHVVEGLSLTVLGSAAGIGVAVVLGKLFAGQSLLGLPPFSGVELDWRVLLFAVLVCLSTGVVFGVLPAVPALRRDAVAHLKEGTRADVGRGSRVRAALTVVQLAASTALVVGAVLLARTVRNLNNVDLGFDPNGVVLMAFDPTAQGYTPERLRTLRAEVLRRVQAQPGVTSASVGGSAPFAAVARVDLRLPSDLAKEWPVQATSFFVSPEYFATLGMRLVAGRTFAAGEFDAPGSDMVLLSHKTAKRLFGAANPLGQVIIERGYRANTSHTVIGVVADTRSGSLRSTEPGDYMFTARPSVIDNMIFVLVRSPRSRADVEAVVRSTVRELDAALPFWRAELLTDTIGRSITEERLFAKLVGLLAALAAALAAIGLYAVIAYSVAERTREIGVRMALGARADSIVGMVVRQAGRLAVIGLAIGIVAAVALSKVLEARLFGVTRLDVPTYVAAALASLALAAIASALPARTATRVDPVLALRSE